MENRDIQFALEYATKAHKGQTSKNGTPFIYHPMAVAGIVGGNFNNNKVLQTAALLHDVIEDTEITSVDLIEEGFSEYVVTVVEYLTRQDGETYKEFVGRCSNHTDATIVKICDIIHNIRRASDLPSEEEERGLRKRWGSALTFLWEKYQSRGEQIHNGSFEITVQKTIEENWDKYNRLEVDNEPEEEK